MQIGTCTKWYLDIPMVQRLTNPCYRRTESVAKIRGLDMRCLMSLNKIEIEVKAFYCQMKNKIALRVRPA